MGSLWPLARARGVAVSKLWSAFQVTGSTGALLRREVEGRRREGPSVGERAWRFRAGARRRGAEPIRTRRKGIMWL